MVYRPQNSRNSKFATDPVMTQGETVEELEENLRDAFRLLILDDVPANAQMKALVI